MENADEEFIRETAAILAGEARKSRNENIVDIAQALLALIEPDLRMDVVRSMLAKDGEMEAALLTRGLDAATAAEVGLLILAERPPVALTDVQPAIMAEFAFHLLKATVYDDEDNPQGCTA